MSYAMYSRIINQRRDVFCLSFDKAIGGDRYLPEVCATEWHHRDV